MATIVNTRAVKKEPKGDLVVGLCYIPDAKNLIVKVKNAKNLQESGFVGRADPYVKVKLWQKNKPVAKAKTETSDEPIDPVFNKTLVFDLKPDDLKDTKIEFTVMDEDLVKDDVMGHVVIGAGTNHWNQVIASPGVELTDLHSLSESSSITASKYHNPAVNKGQLLVGLCYQATARKMIVKVKQAKDLLEHNDPDPYVKIFLFHNDKLAQQAKTDTQKDTQAPVFDSTQSTHYFDLDQGAGLKNIKIGFIVMDEDFGIDDEIGQIVLDAADKQLNQVFTTPDVEVDEWHSLN